MKKIYFYHRNYAVYGMSDTFQQTNFPIFSLLGPYFVANDPNFFLEIAKDNFTTPITGLDRVVAYWSSGISISVSISEQMLDLIFEAPLFYKGNKTKGLLGKLRDETVTDFSGA